MPLQKITKEDIMNRGLLVFLKQGYHKTTMDDLAKACGLFKGSFYYYFPSKEALMKAILENSLVYVEKNVFSYAYAPNLSANERLRKLFEAQQQMLLGYEGGCLFASMVLETALTIPEFREPLKAFFEMWENALTRIFKAAMHENTARQKAIETITRVEGALVLVIVRNENRYLEDVFRGVLADFK
jgi:TetR/AcrR family transcriptional repressor of nem operon